MSRRDEAYSLLTWRNEHEQIERRVLAVEQAVAASTVKWASRAIETLADAFEDHFSVEELAYLPMVERLSPRGTEFAASVQLAHAQLRESLEQLRELIELARWPEAGRSFALLAERFRAHEAEENSFADEVMRIDPDQGRRIFTDS